MNMTIRDLIESGAKLNINYHQLASRDIAEKKLSQFKSLGSIESIENYGKNEDTNWLEIDEYDLGIEVSAFYDKPSHYEVDVDYQTEEARAKLTEQERAMRDAGHKLSDFM